MPGMNYAEFNLRRENWNPDANSLMSREEVEQFDSFFADANEANQYKNEGMMRALVGDFSQYETVEPFMKAYLGAKKCYELFDKFEGNAANPELQQEIRNRLMEVDLRAGFAMGAKKDPPDDFSRFMKECDRSANRQMLLQTLEEPDTSAKLRLLDQFKRKDANTAQQKLNETLNNDIEQRVEIAKMLFMSHLGQFQLYDSNKNPVDMNENVSEVYTHGGRTMFIMPAGGDQAALMDGIQGSNREASGLQRRGFATHSLEARTFKSDGSIASEAKELKVGGLNAFAPRRHKGMNASVGGLGQVGPNGKLITSDGTNGHMYMHMVKGDKNTCGMMLVGFENSGPQTKGRLGHTHDASAKKAGSSAFLSDKSYVGSEYGGRVVDLSGLSSEQLTGLLTSFEARYRDAAYAAQHGQSELLDACNELLTGKPMSVGQMKGMLEGLDVNSDLVKTVDLARAGHSSSETYNPLIQDGNEPVPLNLDRNPQKKPFRVTECEGLVRPEPPKHMKKPGFWDKVFHYLSFGSSRSYVSRYNEHERTLADQIADYKERMDNYNSQLEALERGEGDEVLRANYDRAVEQAQRAFGIAVDRPLPDIAQRYSVNENDPANNELNASNLSNEAQMSNDKSSSPEVIEELENALLNSLFGGAVSNKALDEKMEELRTEYLGYIRQTNCFQKLAGSGDNNIHSVLGDPAKMNSVLSVVSNSIMEITGYTEEKPNVDAPQKTNEQLEKPAEGIGFSMG